MVEEEWYYMQNDQSIGPFSETQITTMVESGTLAKNILVWKKGNEWKPAKDALNIQLPPPLPNKGLINFSFEKEKLFTRSWSEIQPHPWRRYFARMLDISLHAYITSAVLGGAWYAVDESSANSFFSIFEGDSGRILNAIYSTAIAMFLTAAFVGFTGTSVGKWLNGIRVTTSEGRPLGFRAAMDRELKVWIRGMGFGIPLVTIFTAYSSYQRLMNEGNTSWDSELGVKVHYLNNSLLQIVLSVISVLILCIMIGSLAE